MHGPENVKNAKYN